MALTLSARRRRILPFYVHRPLLELLERRLPPNDLVAYTGFGALAALQWSGPIDEGQGTSRIGLHSQGHKPQTFQMPEPSTIEATDTHVVQPDIFEKHRTVVSDATLDSAAVQPDLELGALYDVPTGRRPLQHWAPALQPRQLETQDIRIVAPHSTTAAGALRAPTASFGSEDGAKPVFVGVSRNATTQSDATPAVQTAQRTVQRDARQVKASPRPVTNATRIDLTAKLARPIGDAPVTNGQPRADPRGRERGTDLADAVHDVAKGVGAQAGDFYTCGFGGIAGTVNRYGSTGALEASAVFLPNSNNRVQLHGCDVSPTTGEVYVVGEERTSVGNVLVHNFVHRISGTLGGAPILPSAYSATTYDVTNDFVRRLEAISVSPGGSDVFVTGTVDISLSGTEESIIDFHFNGTLTPIALGGWNFGSGVYTQGKSVDSDGVNRYFGGRLGDGSIADAFYFAVDYDDATLPWGGGITLGCETLTGPGTDNGMHGIEVDPTGADLYLGGTTQLPAGNPGISAGDGQNYDVILEGKTDTATGLNFQYGYCYFGSATDWGASDTAVDYANAQQILVGWFDDFAGGANKEADIGAFDATDTSGLGNLVGTRTVGDFASSDPNATPDDEMRNFGVAVVGTRVWAGGETEVGTASLGEYGNDFVINDHPPDPGAGHDVCFGLDCNPPHDGPPRDGHYIGDLLPVGTDIPATSLIINYDAGGVTDSGPPQDPPAIPPPGSGEDCGAVGSGRGGGPCNNTLVQNAPGACCSGDGGASEGPIRYFDGTIVGLASTDLHSNGFGQPWGHTRNWSNHLGYAADHANGSGQMVTQMPFLIEVGTSGTVALVTNGSTSLYFDFVAGQYNPKHFGKEKLTHSSGEFTLTDTVGNRLVFDDFADIIVAQRGQIKRHFDPASNETIINRDGAGRVQEVQRSTTVGGAVTESFLYTYASGRVSNVQLRRGPTTSGPWTVIRQVDYHYYGGSDPNGNNGDLQRAIVKDGSASLIGTKYYRYYKAGQQNGFEGGLKYVFNDESFARLDQAIGDPLTATDAQVAPYADMHFEYDSLRRVTKETVQGKGCSSCSDGRGTFTFDYHTNPAVAAGYNVWQMRTTETLPDGNQNVVYSSSHGQVMLKIFRETSTDREWKTFYQYDTLADNEGRLLMKANPSAVTGYDEDYLSLIDNNGGELEYIADNAGLIERTGYVTTGTGAGYFRELTLHRGESDTLGVKQRTVSYTSHTDTVHGVTVVLPLTDTLYKSATGGGAEPVTTTFGYDIPSNSTQPECKSTTYPIVGTGQNGSGGSESSLTYFNAFGHGDWTKDADGYIHYREYDSATGAMMKMIDDVDTTQVPDEPVGWVSLPGAKHLTTILTPDGLGRTTKRVAPNLDTTYFVFNDTKHEVRTYPGWDDPNDRPTGPTQVTREDWDFGYTETLTLSTQPTVDGNGVPIANQPTINMADVQTLSRTYSNLSGQPISIDGYFSLTGLSYTPNPTLGAEGHPFLPDSP